MMKTIDVNLYEVTIEWGNYDGAVKELVGYMFADNLSNIESLTKYLLENEPNVKGCKIIKTKLLSEMIYDGRHSE